MRVEEVVKYAKLSALKQIPLNSEEDMIGYVHAAMIEMARKFNLFIESTNIKVHSDISHYSIENKNVSQIIELVSCTGRELVSASVVGAKRADYRMLTSNSFILYYPSDTTITVVYKKIPALPTSLDAETGIAYDFLEAMISYMGYMTHLSIDNEDDGRSSDAYLVRYQRACQELDAQGYNNTITYESISPKDKGFV